MLGRVFLALVVGALAGCVGEATFTVSNISAACSEDSDCPPPPPEAPCRAARCSEGQCQLPNVAAGTPIAEQEPGDCSIAVCDENGEVTQQSDGSDVIDDGNPCTLEGCSPDGPRLAQAPMGIACAPKACCDARGMCTGSCVSNEECTPPDSGCATGICNDCGQCELEVLTQGMPAASDVPGDCFTWVCDGTGSVIGYQDPSDVPFDSDGDLCTIEYCDDEGMPATKLVDCPLSQTCYMGVCG